MLSWSFLFILDVILLAVFISFGGHVGVILGSSENDFTDEDIQLAYQILLASKRDYIYAPDKKDYLIMVLLRLIIFSDRVNKKSNGNLS